MGSIPIHGGNSNSNGKSGYHSEQLESSQCDGNAIWKCLKKLTIAVAALNSLNIPAWNLDYKTNLKMSSD